MFSGSLWVASGSFWVASGSPVFSLGFFWVASGSFWVVLGRSGSFPGRRGFSLALGFLVFVVLFCSLPLGFRLRWPSGFWVVLGRFWVVLGRFWVACVFPGFLLGRFWVASGSLLDRFWVASGSPWVASGSLLGRRGFFLGLGVSGFLLFSFALYCSSLFCLAFFLFSSGSAWVAPQSSLRAFEKPFRAPQTSSELPRGFPKAPQSSSELPRTPRSSSEHPPQSSS